MNQTELHIQSAKKQLFLQIAHRDTVSKADLLMHSGLSSSKLARLLEEMANEGIIEEIGLGPSSGGRRPILYQLNGGYRYFFGLDISRMASTLGLFDMRMNAKSLVHWRMDEAMTPEALVDYTAARIRELLRDHQLAASRVAGIGIGAVGPLDRESGTILTPRHFAAAGWRQVPICRLLEQATGIPALLENGANTALMGEHWSIRHEQVNHALYVHAGVSIRSAMMSYGQIVHGSVDREDAIGQMVIHTDGPRLQQGGNYGALEAYASVLALEAQARSHARLGINDLPERYRVMPEQIDYELLARAVRDQDSYTEGLFRQSAAYFGIGLANLINIFHPELVILGGALLHARTDYFQIATGVARNHIYHSQSYTPQFSTGMLKEDAVVTGAALSVRQRLNV